MQRSRNGFLISLWVAKHCPEAFSSLEETTRTILLTMLASQANQKLGRKPKFEGIISGKEASLLWRIQSSNSREQETLLRHTLEFGLNLVRNGFITITPDEKLEKWNLILSPEGNMLAERLNAQNPKIQVNY